MRVVLDSNILLSALISPHGPPHRIYEAWRQRRFELVTTGVQLDELRRSSRDILIAVVGGLRGFSEATNAVSPQTQMQACRVRTCIVHLLRHSSRPGDRGRYGMVRRAHPMPRSTASRRVTSSSMAASR